MTPETKTTVARIAIAGAFVMALSCTMKITAFHFGAPIVAQWVNVIMNALVVYGCYRLGKLADLARSHRLLCATAMVGYVLYGVILIFANHIDNFVLSESVLIFFVLTLFVSIWFLIDLVRTDIKHTEEIIEEMEEDFED